MEIFHSNLMEMDSLFNPDIDVNLHTVQKLRNDRPSPLFPEMKQGNHHLVPP